MDIGQIGRNKSVSIINSKELEFKEVDLLDNFSKLALLLLLSGYKLEDEIYLFDRLPEQINEQDLNQFLSYVVNHPNAPKNFAYSVTCKPSNSDIVARDITNHNKSVEGSILCFSGGIDSTAGLLYCLDKKVPVKPLFIDFKQRNGESEVKSVEGILHKLKIEPKVISLDLKKIILDGWKSWDFIIPGRNFLFLCLAKSLAKNQSFSPATIYLCANKEEMRKWKHHDKSKYFFRKMNTLIRDDKDSQNVEFSTPFEKYSKTEILYWWKTNCEKKYGLSPYDTSTCYYEKKCGKCRACFRRTISLLAAGYEVDRDLEVHPLSDPVLFIKNIWIPEIKAGKISRTGKLDFYIALEKSLNILPQHLSDFYQTLRPITIKAIQRRKNEIKSVRIV